MKSIVNRGVCLSGLIVAQIVGILDGDRGRHLDRNRILSQQSVSVRDECIRTYNVYACATSSQIGNPYRDDSFSSAPIVDSIENLSDRI